METVTSTQTLIVRRFSLMPYEPVWRAMQDFTQQRDAETTDEVWLLQHEPVFTQGQAGDAEHVLFPGDIPVVQVDRGGQVTYHGPGQLMVYLLLDLRRLKMGARDLVTMIENTLVDTLAGYGIEAHARKDAPGVYVGDAKIASLGLRIRRGSSFHGLALNVDMDLEPFLRINPCGYQGLRMTQIKEFVPDVSWASVADAWLSQFVRVAGFQSVVEQRGLPGDE
ncbi:lipoyl(octanoyl) transferase LipB [Hahella sp. KA22]|uniref:lipoyl(octanoyl) transferase LipB n=1 Tax=Hahella sp. KA22 TaxID=1628392 RepID=UPI000FDE14E9|nr:lipoyl(octanoyl) transferase LipB [Hahella sp. KA22]AZZ95420.1 lipoyl(octanoyl) transferase LipB [Hahella sp. KA22]QAY58347.1 lipoyl(octanoyl) transferase LipB [Hahella sp. KA22]